MNLIKYVAAGIISFDMFVYVFFWRRQIGRQDIHPNFSPLYIVTLGICRGVVVGWVLSYSIVWAALMRARKMCHVDPPVQTV